MVQAMTIALGGALGALSRFWLSNLVYSLLGRDFPYGTIAVNIIGSLLMGVFYILLLQKMPGIIDHRALIMVGFLGAFTTFSTFSLETLLLLEQGNYTVAILNVLLSVTLCIIAAWLGMTLARQF